MPEVPASSRSATASMVRKPSLPEILQRSSFPRRVRAQSATLHAGNSEAPHNLAIKLDKAPPLISDSRFPAANACGWNNVPVTVTFPCSDTLSGVAAGIPPMVFSAEGLDQSVNRTCFDVAGNSAGDTASGINIDFTP